MTRINQKHQASQKFADENSAIAHDEKPRRLLKIITQTLEFS